MEKPVLIAFSDMMEKIDHLSKEEVLQIRKVIEQRWIEIRREEILKNSEVSRELAKEGKLFGSNNIEEILNWLHRDEDFV